MKEEEVHDQIDDTKERTSDTENYQNLNDEFFQILRRKQHMYKCINYFRDTILNVPEGGGWWW